LSLASEMLVLRTELLARAPLCLQISLHLRKGPLADGVLFKPSALRLDLGEGEPERVLDLLEGAV